MPDFMRDIVSFFSANVTENTFIAVGTTISAVCSAYLVFMNRSVIQPYIQRDGLSYKFVNNFQHPVILRQVIIFGGTFYEFDKNYTPGEGCIEYPSDQSIKAVNETVYFGESVSIRGVVDVGGKRFETTAKVVKAAFGNKIYDVILTPSNPA